MSRKAIRFTLTRRSRFWRRALGAGQATRKRSRRNCAPGKPRRSSARSDLTPRAMSKARATSSIAGMTGNMPEIDAVQTSRWIGTIRLGKEESRLRFDIEDNHGTLSGTSWFADPETGAWCSRRLFQEIDSVIKFLSPPQLILRFRVLLREILSKERWSFRANQMNPKMSRPRFISRLKSLLRSKS